MGRQNIGLFLLLSLLGVQYSFAQLTTNNTRTPAQLIEQVLAGEGVEISNITFSGKAIQRGEFGGVSNIGLSSGIILSTGTVLDQTEGGGTKKIGPVGPNNNTGSVHVKNDLDAHDLDLAQLANRPLNETLDAVVLEFDFIPEGDSISFNYVFASEEYPRDYISGNSQINDVFGFFISGPGIAGTQNIAVLNDGVTEVSATTINPNTNSALYNSNGDGTSGSPQFSDVTVVNYDGFTDVLTARAAVTPCQVYHLKLALCDIKDQNFDTGVFLEANSLYSEPKYSFRKSADFAPLGADTILPEGCANGELFLERTENLNTTLKVGFTTGGSATSGIDYNLSVADTVVFNPGESSKSILISTIRDAMVEGDETVRLTFANPSVCANNAFVSFTYIIRDQPAINTNTGNSAITCPGEPINITANVSGGVPGYSLNWSTSLSNNETITVSPNTTTTYYYTAQDTCGNLSNQDSIVVNVPVYAPLQASSSNDRTVRCKGTVVNITSSAVGGAGGYQYEWNTGSNLSSISPTITKTKDFEITITDQCNNESIATTTVTLSAPELVADAGLDQEVCVGDSLILVGGASGGVPKPNGTYNYFWGGASGQSITRRITESRQFILTITDSCGLVPAKDTVQISAIQPLADFYMNASIPEPNQYVDLVDLSEGAISGYWLTSDSQRIDGLSGSVAFSEPGDYVVTQFVEDIQGCKDTLSQVITIKPPVYFYLPNAFTPNGDGRNDEFVGKGIGVNEFSMEIYDRWGVLIFSSNDYQEGWDGNDLSGNPVPNGVYVVKYKAKGASDREYDYLQTVTVVR